MTMAFGPVAGPELAITWAVAVFGSWFLLLIPFMRKKEQIWKRLNQDEEKAVDAWLTGMGIFIGLAIFSCLFWSAHFLGNTSGQVPAVPLHRISVRTGSGLHREWAKAVFGTWLLLALPFLVWMYRKADRIFKAAVIRQAEMGPRFRSVFLEKTKRLLPPAASEKLKLLPPTLQGGHVVKAVLKDGRIVPNCFVLNSGELLGVYDRVQMDFDARDIVDVSAVSAAELPPYEESKWLRLDGRA